MIGRKIFVSTFGNFSGFFLDQFVNYCEINFVKVVYIFYQIRFLHVINLFLLSMMY